MKMIQVEFETFTVVAFPNFGKHGLVQCLIKGSPSCSYTIPEFCKMVNRVARYKLAKRKLAAVTTDEEP